MDALFSLGSNLSVTPNALLQLKGTGVTVAELFNRHVSGDWGDLCPEDVAANHRAIKNGSRILSAYTVGDHRYYVITEAEGDYGEGRVTRYGTTLLLAYEY